MRPFAFVDLETTGATASRDRITEIGIVEIDADGEVREWQQLVNPGVPIPPFIEQLTGISNAMVAAAPSFAEVAEETRRRLDGRLFIAHNARFDYGFLKNEFRRLGIAFRAPVVCTVKLSRALFPEHRRHNLDALIERHGLTADARHRALADAQLIHQFWRKIHADLDHEHITAALREQNANPTLPSHLDPALVDELPDGPGVYLFHGDDERPLYVGKAKNIGQRVLAHFAADRRTAREMALALEVRRIDWIETAGEVGAGLQEALLIKRLQPDHNRLPRRPDETCTWTLVDEGEGWLRPQLAMAAEHDFGVHSARYGLFKTPKEATTVLRALAAGHQLCDALLGLAPRTIGQPCPAYAGKRCKGACVGHEPFARHSMRLVGALSRFKLVSWPFPGPGIIREGGEVHLIDGWRYLGTARSETELHELRETAWPPFERGIYKLLIKQVGRLQPLR
ncbi:exonuclease domain-containing protein [Azonexus sp.]|jgi:DNA polymerase-3 subunit epsilon|uniref:exonuclease domain-containing protein n=1 Tax=Azonexus sp. TaxID=1872668 RepID=UPI002817008D|nr:exonuclease domain-containing protein [Azonexus sp.]MDR1994053.1 3'-5' exoribonuclease [Azonexus sp.]